MKVAMCVSGVPESKYNLIKRNNAVQKLKFPNADFYYATWKGREKLFYENFPDYELHTFDEPVMHYHPYMDIKDFTSPYFEETKSWVMRTNRIEWTSHHTKQILIHAMLLNEIKDDYDVIIRGRFDNFIWNDKAADFTPFVEDTYKNNRANCFAVTNGPKFKEQYESDYERNPKMREWFLDQLIIHPRNMINLSDILQLHKEKKLRAAEYGWHQVLSESYGNNHRNWHGWVNHDKNVDYQFIKEAL